MTGRMGWMVMAVAAAAVARVGAHKPVTSKYTYWEDVQPIVREHCGGCHVAGGIAPMSLMTYEDARPWAESIRLELTTGHMPPWYGDPSVAPLRDVHKLSPRDLDVVLTWVTGGTPPGPAPTSATAPASRGWARGKPDLILPVPAAVTLAAAQAEDTREFVLREATDRDRVIAFADLLPGNPSIVHDATIFTRRGESGEPASLLAAWLPGASPVAAPAGAGFPWRSGEQLVARIHYKKNWKLENKAASDRSSIGLYLAKGSTVRPIRAISIRTGGDTLAIDEAVRALSVCSDAPSDARVEVDAVRPDGSRVALAGFVTRAGWDQRYWLARPIDLPRGTRLEAKSSGSRAIRLWLDVLP